MKYLKSIAVAMTMLSAKAFSLPSFTTPLAQVNFDETTAAGTFGIEDVIPDSIDPNVVYLPWDEVAIVSNRNTQKPIFGFAYSEQSGRVNVSVKVQYSPEAREIIRQLVLQGKTVKPLPVISGSWTIVGYDLRTQQSETAAAGEITREYFQTSFPDKPIGLSFKLSGEDLEQMVKLFETGASLLVQYNYSFRAAVPRTSVRLEVNRSSMMTVFQEYLQQSKRHCIVRPGTGSSEITECNPEGFELVPMAGPNGTTVYNLQESTFSNLDVEVLTRTMIQRDAIKIRTEGFTEAAQEANAIKMAQSYVKDLLFTPIEAQLFEENVATPAYCSITGHPCKKTECTGYQQSLRRRTISDSIQVNSTVDISTYGTEIYNTHVGFALSHACADYRDSIIFAPSGALARAAHGQPIEYQHGCPTSWTITRPNLGNAADSNGVTVDNGTDPAYGNATNNPATGEPAPDLVDTDTFVNPTL